MSSFCELPKVDGRGLTQPLFKSRFEKPGDKPVVLTHLIEAWPAVSRWAEQAFLSDFGNHGVESGDISGNTLTTDGLLGQTRATLARVHGRRVASSSSDHARYNRNDGRIKFNSTSSHEIPGTSERSASRIPSTWLLLPHHSIPRAVRQRRDFVVPGPLEMLQETGPYLSIGRAGTGKQLHNDHPRTWFAQVFGLKRWRLAPPPGRLVKRHGRRKCKVSAVRSTAAGPKRGDDLRRPTGRGALFGGQLLA